MSDPITAAREQEEAGRLPFIAVQEFRVDYKPQADGSQKPVEWVAWVKKGTQNPSVTEERVDLLRKSPDNIIWQVIKPYYERWKEGQTAPVDGTPLAAWPGATPALVKALEPANIRSVEDLARMEDSAVSRIAIPGLRDKRKQAQSYLQAMVSTAGVANENLKLRELVESQASQIAEMRAAIDDLANDRKDAPRRGRPPIPRPPVFDQ